MAGKRHQLRYRYQVLWAALGPVVGVTAVGVATGLAPAWMIMLALGLGGASAIITLVLWWLFRDKYSWRW